MGICGICSGTGYQIKPCPKCRGSVTLPDGTRCWCGSGYYRQTCTHCKGTGYVDD